MFVNGISPSAFSVYNDCEWKYFIGILGFPSEDSAATILGKMAHHIFEILSKASGVQHHKSSKIWDAEYLWKIVYNRYIKKYPIIFASIKQDKLTKLCNGIIKLINGYYTPVKDNTIAVEKYFKIPIERPEFLLDDKKSYFSIRGIIDRIDLINQETIEIIDYKSGQGKSFDKEGRPYKDSISLKDDIQPRMYHLAAKILYPNIKNVIVTFLYFTDQGPVTTIFVDSDLEETINIILRRFRAIKANEDPSRILGTKMGWKCKVMCSYFKDGKCQSLWEEKNKLGLDFVYHKYVTLNFKGKK